MASLHKYPLPPFESYPVTFFIFNMPGIKNKKGQLVRISCLFLFPLTACHLVADNFAFDKIHQTTTQDAFSIFTARVDTGGAPDLGYRL